MSNIDDVARVELQEMLVKLQNEHAELDREVALLMTNLGDQISISRLKRRKLQLKDMIVRLKSSLLPDVPA